ncbi:sensor domain-containing diguanylate cyclase [Photobacterium chitinilyticum]|uniref:sensor domain-containing diguanylate cyclase n=1 Tax=Photobacterium chitinilyticum TaxID=2485123 RepID=UPI003D0BB126
MINELLHAHRAFNKILRMLALGQKKEEMLEQLIDVTENIYNDRLTSILLLNPQTNTLHCACAPSLPEFYNKALEGVPIGPTTGSCGAAAYHKQKVITENINDHHNWASFKPLTLRANLASCWSVPILSSKNKVLGTFATYSREPARPTPFELEILEMAASVCAVTLEKYEIEEELMQSATYDFLTNAYNRRAFCQKTQQELDDYNKHDGFIALFYIDINDFKVINDQYGHAIGDLVLIETAKRLNQLSQKNDIVGRMGGDEFVLLSTFNNEEEFSQLYQLLLNDIGNERFIENVVCSASIGYTLVKRCEADEHDIQSLLSHADSEMYKVKQKFKHKLTC